MKKLISVLSLIGGMLGSVAAQNVYQLPNSDFESDFVQAYYKKSIFSTNTYYEPKGWHGYATIDGSVGSAGRSGSKLVASEDVRAEAIGKKSVYVQATSVLGIVANGVMTTGRVYANSTTATEAEKNYNYSEPGYTDSSNSNSNSSFSQAFNGKPDAMKVWVKFDANEKTQTSANPYASVNAVIHTNARYQDPEAVDYTAVKVAQAKDSEIANYGNWQQLVLPFDYTVGTSDDPQYILVSFTTNAMPGGGTANDKLYIDDIEMVYYSQLASLQYNGVSVEGFDKNKYEYAVNEPYDATKLQVIADGKGAMVTTSYDAATGKCVVRVEGNDISVNASNYHEYTIQFPIVTPFTNALTVCVNGVTSEPQETEIQLVKESDGSYSFALNNFIMLDGEAIMPIGNIHLTNLTVNGNVFTANQTIQILPGDLEGSTAEDWMGPSLGEVPVVLKAIRLSDTEMVADIDIDMTQSIKQMIKVVFAPMVEINGTEEVPALNGLYNIKLSRPFVAGWNTVCLPFAFQTAAFAEAGDVKAQAFDSATEAGLNFVAVEDGVLAANTPYLINFPSATTMPVYFGVNIESTTPQSVTHGDFTFTGTYAAVTDMAGKYGVAKINGEDKITKGAAGSTLKATRAYFTTSGADVQSVSLFFDGEATGIEAVETAGEKAFDVYTISGVQVRRAAKTLDGLQKGIYIVNGKKQVVK